jgi:hypothetical protein
MLSTAQKQADLTNSVKETENIEAIRGVAYSP